MSVCVWVFQGNLAIGVLKRWVEAEEHPEPGARGCDALHTSHTPDHTSADTLSHTRNGEGAKAPLRSSATGDAVEGTGSEASVTSVSLAAEEHVAGSGGKSADDEAGASQAGATTRQHTSIVVSR